MANTTHTCRKRDRRSPRLPLLSIPPHEKIRHPRLTHNIGGTSVPNKTEPTPTTRSITNPAPLGCMVYTSYQYCNSVNVAYGNTVHRNMDTANSRTYHGGCKTGKICNPYLISGSSQRQMRLSFLPTLHVGTLIHYLGPRERDASTVSPEVEEGCLVAQKPKLVAVASPIEAVKLIGCSEEQRQSDGRECNE